MSDNKLVKQLYSADELERCDAIEALSHDIYNYDVAEKIMECFNDRNYLVRCEAYDAFYSYKYKNISEVLVKRLYKERSKFARMHACSTLCSIIRLFGCDKEIETLFREYIKKEKQINVLLSCWCILYLIDKDINYIKTVLSYLDDEDYHIRCNVINLLTDVIDDNIKNLIKSSYEARYKKEKYLSVKDLLKNALILL